VLHPGDVPSFVETFGADIVSPGTPSQDAGEVVIEVHTTVMGTRRRLRHLKWGIESGQVVRTA